MKHRKGTQLTAHREPRAADHSRRPAAAIASSNDPELKALRAPLDAPLTGEQIDAVVRQALDGDPSPRALKHMVSASDSVVIKPNIVTSRSHPSCSYWHDGVAHPGQVTDLRVIKSLIGYLIEHCRPRRITIAEGGAEWRRNGEPGTDPGQKEDGWTVHWPEFEDLSYTEIVDGFNRHRPGLVDIVDLNYDAIHFLPVPDPGNSGIGGLQRIGETVRPVERYGREAYVPGTGDLRQGYYLPETVLTCDKLITVPAMKIHGCGTTLGMKNYVGILPNHPSGLVGKGHVHQGDVQKGFIDLCCYHPADYTLIEGFWSTEGNGPQWGENLHHNVVIASADPVAADAVGSAVMGFNPADLDYLHYAALKRLGSLDLDQIEVAGNAIGTVSRCFRRFTGRKGVGFVTRGNRTWRLKGDAGEDWQVFTSGERYIDLARHLGPRQPHSAWASVEVHAQYPQKGQVWASANGNMTVTLNGQKVVDRASIEEHCLAECRADIKLSRGANLLVVHLERARGEYGFTCLLCDPQGNGLTGTEYRA